LLKVSVEVLRNMPGGEDRTVKMCSVTSDAAVGEPIEAHESNVDSFAVSAGDEFIVSYSTDEWENRVWDVATGDFLRALAKEFQRF
jgi:WD40 repeat protein